MSDICDVVSGSSSSSAEEEDPACSRCGWSLSFIMQCRTRYHKEETDNRRKLDALDRNKIIAELKKHTNPITTEPEEQLSHIISGRIASEEVDVDNTIAIGQRAACNSWTHYQKVSIL